MPVSKDKKANHLIFEKSPYLLQHAYNPVNWYPWGDEAFKKAKDENKLIFLSIGYSTCHWCHVMEKESFEDEEVAKILNQHYICIKVDREERPDIDQIYMNACQAMNQSGGWPLTIIMTSKKEPFFSGTYFPKHSQFNQIGLIELLEQIKTIWQNNPTEIIEISKNITKALQNYSFVSSKGKWGEHTLEKAFSLLEKNYDPVYGGFGKAPKFPSPSTFSFLLRYWKKNNNKKALEMVENTLQAIYKGGIYDHLGYGFSRYSVDSKWLVPHFEKMLYDNALLAFSYLETFQATQNPFYAKVAKEIFIYLKREMTSSEGGFYSAQDADSEGQEGLYYLFSQEEIISILGKSLGEEFCQEYNITPEGNFEGKNIINRLGKEANPPISIETARQKLLEVREKRIRPHTDDKILTAWNALMIASLAKASVILEDNQYHETATKALEFILKKLTGPNSRLLARYRDKEANHNSCLDDYAYLIRALLNLYQADYNPIWLKKALELQEKQDNLFWDNKEGGYFFYGEDSEKLILRPKEIYDGATPSGNSASALNLLYLTKLTANPKYQQKALLLLDYFGATISEYPPAYAYSLVAIDFFLSKNQELVILSPENETNFKKFLQPFNQNFNPQLTLLYSTSKEPYNFLKELAPFTKEMSLLNQRTTFYLCQNNQCISPTNDFNKIQQEIFA